MDDMELALELLNPSQIQEKYWYIFFLVCTICFIYFLSRSFIRWVIHRNAILLLSYLVISLFIFTIYFAISLLNGGLNTSFFQSFPLIMQSLAVFGLILILRSMFKYWLK
ncbi:hypothetical protein J32TS6_08070 [Virgibacillus pantothenticus]|uniref:Uncharacterized protein n=1 Tax=Virgibacillus pantothenticus TaxID=1473 RepID=A0A0L0QN49_VIRPA|nr:MULTISPECIES: hypothetical protein [Virgibacillus]API93730.1 hypothetical protein BKP57_19095 [Virgibacillus sp. 6R]KNE20017.1 hypothetical protein AFK71_16610 [Virgibacillus pantothenticus]MBS7429858.1 hypothetical protein [Virgibacillus sp. 19R1-5]MED3737345.1 hypothetical protein [Virgibacillus pantothenticus]QTY18236.1 hypothetical protein KBP50_10590 [Virgibacillus pantothenticus]